MMIDRNNVYFISTLLAKSCPSLGFCGTVIRVRVLPNSYQDCVIDGLIRIWMSKIDCEIHLLLMGNKIYRVVFLQVIVLVFKSVVCLVLVFTTCEERV